MTKFFLLCVYVTKDKRIELDICNANSNHELRNVVVDSVWVIDEEGTGASLNAFDVRHRNCLTESFGRKHCSQQLSTCKVKEQEKENGLKISYIFYII